MSRLARLAAAHGVSPSYEPSPGRTAFVPDATLVEVLAALGVDAGTPQAVREALRRHEQESLRLLPHTVVLRTKARTGDAGDPERAAPPPALRALPEGTALRVITEGGQARDWGPGAALPPGVHTLHAQAPDGRAAHAVLIAAPGRLPAPQARPGTGRGYGLLVQLYSLLSSRSWGMGDLGDLADLASWAGRSQGADFLQLNPLHAAVPRAPGEHTDPSPYRPSSRRFPDPVYLRVEDVPEYAYLPEPERARAAALLGRAAALREGVLREGALIDRDAVWDLKREALELVREVPLSPGRRAAYCDYLAERGQALDDHATWHTLAELHGPDWSRWPAGLDDPRSARTARARAEHLERVDFHCWLTWLADTQLAAAQHTAREAGMPVGLVHDLAVGVHPRGADVWSRQDAFARGISVGAPPDAFNARGQDWGLPPWRPDTLAETGYAAYREVLAGQFRTAGALRLDHVMGQSRLWWIPEGRPPTEGAYVRYDTEAMLGVLALEAHRAGSAVIGEDLGTVEPGMREDLERRGVLGTSVLWFERDYEAEGAPPLLPERWRADCLATATTHDLPSTAARLTGEHVELRHRLGLLARSAAAERAADAAETAEWLELFTRLGLIRPGRRLGPGGGPGAEEEGVTAVYRFLARTPARMLGIWLPDALGDRRPQNLPGTLDEYPNWRLPIASSDGTPASLEEIVAAPRARALFAAVREALAEHPPVRA
ncbi:4-alpha-glucanotransferase [Streptomyces sp. ODS28]|uniref:4-alpha-glucanotransferase n=1 Tax=Streptomyces sp. ODS28 TaxID=3136688 RepID=UPI0031E57F63